MKNLFKTLAVILALGCCSFSNSQSANKKNSVLWEVSGNGLTKPSYLFGTIHMICGKDFVMWPKASEAFSKTTKLALEINMADAEEMAAAQQMAFGKEPLSKQLTPKQIARLEQVLQKNGIPSLAVVDNYTLETVMSLIFMKSFGCTDLKFYEMEFSAKAKESNKPIVGLEKVSEQLAFLDQSFTDEEMICYLQKITPDMCNDMVREYTTQDIESLYKTTTEKESMSASTKKILLDNRNANWLKAMPVMMQKESVFFALGAAHLAGETGLINLLKNAGYTLKPIMN